MTTQLRTILIILVVTAVGIPTLVMASKFNVGSIRFNVTVEQPITCDPACNGETEVDFTLFPGQSQTFEIAISNRSDTNLDGTLTAHKNPDTDDITVEVPETFLIPGNDTTRQRIVIRASRSAEADDETRVTLQLEAGEYP